MEAILVGPTHPGPTLVRVQTAFSYESTTSQHMSPPGWEPSGHHISRPEVSPVPCQAVLPRKIFQTLSKAAGASGKPHLL